MSVALLVVTHGRIGEELLASATRILGGRPLPCASYTVEQNCDPAVTVLPQLLQNAMDQYRPFMYSMPGLTLCRHAASTVSEN